jgi:hypothetical protein
MVMSKHKKDPLLEALKEGRSHTWTVPDGGNLASMRKAIKHGQTLTMSPITDPGEIRVGDMVLVKWHESDIFHLVGEIQGGKYLIVNSLGGVNGWVEAKDILGRITKVVEPEARPSVQRMLEQLETIFQALVKEEEPTSGNAERLLSIVDDLRWYAERIGSDHLDVMPRSNKWSFTQNLWWLVKRARQVHGSTAATERVPYMIDCGKKCVGLSGEIFALFEYHDPLE